ncbi:MAG TPA: tyrosine-type recombinase/integrase [Tissierellia bacterium]|nr:tyrosine-type recombinase/integrase [Tissierellia bacterium]
MFLEIEDYLFDCQSRGLSHKTLKNYRNHLIRFEKYIIGQKIDEMRKIQPIHIKKFMKLKQDEGCTNTYCNSIYKVLKVFFEYCIENEYIIKNPMKNITPAREEKKIIEVFNDKEVNRLINYYDYNNYLNARNKAIVNMMFDTGIRTTELISITNDDIQVDRIKINGKGAKERFVALSVELKKVLRRYEKIKSNYFYGKDIPNNYFLSRTGRRLTVETIERIFKIAGEECKVRENIRCTGHTARHYFATKMMQTHDIYTVQKMLGHSSIQNTEKYIATLTDEKLIDKGKITSPLMNLKGGRK